MAQQQPLNRMKPDLIDAILIKLGLLRCQLNDVDGTSMINKLNDKSIADLKLLNQRLNPYLIITDKEN